LLKPVIMKKFIIKTVELILANSISYISHQF
jgi:hypothetical protein